MTRTKMTRTKMSWTEKETPPKEPGEYLCRVQDGAGLVFHIILDWNGKWIGEELLKQKVTHWHEIPKCYFPSTQSS